MNIATSCIDCVLSQEINTVEELHTYAIERLKTSEFQEVISSFISILQEQQPNKNFQKPKWHK